MFCSLSGEWSDSLTGVGHSKHGKTLLLVGVSLFNRGVGRCLYLTGGGEVSLFNRGWGGVFI